MFPYQEPVRQHLDPRDLAVEHVLAHFRHVIREAQLDHLARRQPLDQLER